MKKYTSIVFFTLLLFTSKLYAQEEVYDQPVRIIDTLYDESSNKTTEPGTKSKKQAEKERYDALTELEKKKEKLNRVRIGLGNFSFQLGSFTFIQATPTAGYMVIKDRLEFGAGPVLMFQRIRYTNNFSQSFFVYGSDIYTRGFIYKGLNLEARYDAVNKPSYYNIDRRLWVHHLLLGAGYAIPMGEIGVFNISLLYNVLDNDESIYQGTFSSKVPVMLNTGFAFGVGGK